MNKIKEALQEVNIYDYITPQALTAIKHLEGHYKGLVTPKRADGKNDVPTTFYGLTQNALNALKDLKNYGVKVPERLLKLQLKDVSEKDAREITGYCAVHNTKVIDSYFKDEGMEYFYKLPKEIRCGVLSVMHTGGVYKLGDSYKDPKAYGSLLKAIKTGSRERIARALISGADGRLMSPIDGSYKDGRKKRLLAGVRMMYDTECDSFSTQKKKDDTFKSWQNINTVRNFDTHLNSIYRAERLKELEDEDNWALAETKMADEISIMPQVEEQEPPIQETNTVKEKQDMLASQKPSAFTTAIKNLFTRNKGDNNYTGNIDLSNRPRVKNPDGSISTVRSMSYNEDGKEVLIPTVSDEGKIMEDNEAIDYWKKKGQNLGVFNSVDEANKAAEWIHKDQEKRIGV